jgi:hypothetical protein
MSASREGDTASASETKFNVWRQQAAIFDDVSAYYFDNGSLTGVGQPVRVNLAFVTGHFFRLFGFRLSRGRSFNREDERPNSVPVAVLSDELWKKSFGADPRIIGRTILLSGNAYQIVGLASPDLQWETDVPPDVWLPLTIQAERTNQALCSKGEAETQGRASDDGMFVPLSSSVKYALPLFADRFCPSHTHIRWAAFRETRI